MTAFRGAVKIASGKIGLSEYVSKEEYFETIKVCNGCPEFSRVKKGWCGEPIVETDTSCGCFVYEKAKLKDERCPQGKWKRE